MTDTNVKKVEQVLLIGLTKKDYEALKLIAQHTPRVKNYGVLVRRLIQAEAKRVEALPIPKAPSRKIAESQ